MLRTGPSHGEFSSGGCFYPRRQCRRQEVVKGTYHDAEVCIFSCTGRRKSVEQPAGAKRGFGASNGGGGKGRKTKPRKAKSGYALVSEVGSASLPITICIVQFAPSKSFVESHTEPGFLLE